VANFTPYKPALGMKRAGRAVILTADSDADKCHCAIWHELPDIRPSRRVKGFYHEWVPEPHAGLFERPLWKALSPHLI